MSPSANVLSIEAIKDFKNAMITFGEDASNSLGGVNMELRRMRDWLERDRLSYWKFQVKKRSEAVMQARSDLARRKLMQQGKGSDAVSDAEQKEALRIAKQRLQVAEKKVVLVKKLIPELHHAIAEYHSHSQPLSDHLSGGFKRSLAGLDARVMALEAYLATLVPIMRREEPNGTTSTAPSAAPPAAEASDGQDATATQTQSADGAANGSPVPASEALVSGTPS